MPLGEFFAKLPDYAAKYAWPIFAVCAFVLFVPRGIAEEAGIIELRQAHLAWWWLLLVFTAALMAGKAVPLAYSKYVVHRKNVQTAIEAENKSVQRHIHLLQTLESLRPEEEMWLLCCLAEGTQTLFANRANPVAQSLVYKGLLSEGSGHILNLPFHIKKDVWEHLLENEARFLDGWDIKSREFRGRIRDFKEYLHTF